jgi:hypothetical protein
MLGNHEVASQLVVEIVGLNQSLWCLAEMEKLKSYQLLVDCLTGKTMVMHA